MLIHLQYFKWYKSKSVAWFETPTYIFSSVYCLGAKKCVSSKQGHTKQITNMPIPLQLTLASSTQGRKIESARQTMIIHF
jgi:hypothetical protein